jgi:DNA-binding transcriptional LysR family regulator
MGPVVTIRPHLACNSNEAACGAARAGWGISRLLSYQIGPEIANGSLKIVLADFEPEPMPIHVIRQGRHATAGCAQPAARSA